MISTRVPRNGFLKSSNTRKGSPRHSRVLVCSLQPCVLSTCRYALPALPSFCFIVDLKRISLNLPAVGKFRGEQAPWWVSLSLFSRAQYPLCPTLIYASGVLKCGTSKYTLNWSAEQVGNNISLPSHYFRHLFSSVHVLVYDRGVCVPYLYRLGIF